VYTCGETTCGDITCGDENDAGTDKCCVVMSNEDGAVNEESRSSSVLPWCWNSTAPLQAFDWKEFEGVSAGMPSSGKSKK
jgi:hypothetical protein